jgi:hypothetical protein
MSKHKKFIVLEFKNSISAYYDTVKYIADQKLQTALKDIANETIWMEQFELFFYPVLQVIFFKAFMLELRNHNRSINILAKNTSTNSKNGDTLLPRLGLYRSDTR